MTLAETSPIIRVHASPCGVPVRTSIDIDETLLRLAMKATGATIKKAVVEQGLQMLVKLHRQRAILPLGGKVRWQADLDARRVRRFDSD